MRKDFLRMRRGAAVILLSLLAIVSNALSDEALDQG
jgi:hypothetical protein